MWSGVFLVPAGQSRDLTYQMTIPNKPGTYTIYCSIPGHRAAGMEATVDVGAAAAPEGGAPGAPPSS